MENNVVQTILLLVFMGIFQPIAYLQTVKISSEKITTSRIRMNIGEVLAFEATGTVELGFWVGASTPEGLIGVNVFDDYNVRSDALHGALLARVGTGVWQEIGSKGVLVADRKGKVQFRVNDIDLSNNSGFYQAKVVQLNNRWLRVLPDCPCMAPDKNKTGDWWAKDKDSAVRDGHKGAKICFRSYPSKRTAEGDSGQQCCYDAQNKLITGGTGAGTPDKQSSCIGEDSDGDMNTWIANLHNHVKDDVIPFKLMSLNRYLGIWKPNNDLGCPVNIVNRP